VPLRPCRVLDTLPVQLLVDDVGTGLPRMDPTPELAEAGVVGPAAQGAGPVARGECRRLVEKEQLGEPPRLQQRRAAPPAELEPARDPAAPGVPSADPSLVVVEAAAVAVNEAPSRIRDQLAEGCDPVLQRHRRTLADFYSMATPESGLADGVSPELILVSEEDVAERARAGLAPIVPTDERLLAESSARVRAGLRMAEAPAPAAPPMPVTQTPPVVAEPPPPPAPPPPRRRRRRLGFRVAGLAALIPIAAVGAALGAGWNPVSGGSSSAPETIAPPPPTGHVGTATSRVTHTAPPATTHHTPPVTPSTHHLPTTAAATSTATHRHRRPARTTTRPTSTRRHSTTTAPPATTRPKPPPPIKPSRVFAWPAAANANFYLVRFSRNGVQIYQDRVAAPRLTLPARLVLQPGHYHWTVLPALGTAKNPRYGPAIVDSQFDVAG
jgi:hypothetical protein